MFFEFGEFWPDHLSPYALDLVPSMGDHIPERAHEPEVNGSFPVETYTGGCCARSPQVTAASKGV